jgi:hypothetical protein
MTHEERTKIDIIQQGLKPLESAIIKAAEDLSKAIEQLANAVRFLR